MEKTIVIACLKWGKQFGPSWVNLLFGMVRRYLPPELSCSVVCFTDDTTGIDATIETRALPGNLSGWWNKLYLFKKDVFEPDTRIVYFDLDTLIIGDLKPLMGYRGEFALLRDFYRPEGYGSGVMLWRAGAAHSIWEAYDAAGSPEIAGGDQAWIERSYKDADRLQDLFPGTIASYKTDCAPLPPAGTRVVCFHGDPKQDDCSAPWVRDAWMGLVRDKPYKTRAEELLDHARAACALPCPWLAMEPPHARRAVIVAGGVSLASCVEALQEHREKGDAFFAINNSAAWLHAQGISADVHVIAGTIAEHADFILEGDAARYYASTCHPAVFQKSKHNTVIWHPTEIAEAKFITGDPRPKTPIPGKTAGINVLHIAHALGYRSFHIYGLDSSYSEDGLHHAYAQPQSDTDRRLVATFEGRRFSAAPWMIEQAKEFFPMADALIRSGCNVIVCGEGLIPFMAECAVRQSTAP